MKTSLRAPTQYEQERIEALKRLGCVACAVLGVPNVNQLELHHILSGGTRMGHWFTIFLCRGHHQGHWSDLQLEWLTPEQRVAVSDGRKLFVAVYGTERELWERCQERLKLSLAWPVSKRVPRRIYAATNQGVGNDSAHQTAAPADAPRELGSGMGVVQGELP